MKKKFHWHFVDMYVSMSRYLHLLQEHTQPTQKIDHAGVTFGDNYWELRSWTYTPKVQDFQKLKIRCPQITVESSQGNNRKRWNLHPGKLPPPELIEEPIIRSCIALAQSSPPSADIIEEPISTLINNRNN